MNVRAIAPEEYEAVQQSRTIKGTVVDKNGEAVIGANVVVKGTSKGTITDVDGRFTLNGVPEKAGWPKIVSIEGPCRMSIPR